VKKHKLFFNFLKSTNAIIGGVIIVLFFLIALLAPLLAPQPPNALSLKDALTPPCREYTLGTDEFGRSILSRIMFGARVSLNIALIASAVALGIGVPLGALGGYYGGWFDSIVQGLVDLTWAFPTILAALAIMFILGTGLHSVMIAVGVVYWAGYARITRGQFLALREEEYVQAARAVGASNLRIVWRHLLPNSLAPLLVQLSLGMGQVILIEASLSFLGLGAQPPTPSWGAMLSNGRAYLLAAPWLTLFPGLAIMLVVLGFNLMGDGLRDALDPRLSHIKG
jgi:ABC-type dipeptide/oligopeptide/nickel transport system permease subunit